jgi:very-short-patch-repair endonuclease
VIYREIYGKKDFFILDFYCNEKKIAVELDGPIHDQQKDYDQSRDQILLEIGIKVIRYKNEEVNQMELFLQKILNELNFNA